MLKVGDKFIYEPAIDKTRYMLWQYISGDEILKREPLYFARINDANDFKNTQFEVIGINYKHSKFFFWRKKYDLDIQNYVLRVVDKIKKY